MSLYHRKSELIYTIHIITKTNIYEKTKLLCLWLWALFCYLSPQTVFSQKKVATVDNPQLGYGILLFDQGAETNKLVSFQMPDVSSFETVYDLGYNYCSAGACVDGVYYLASVSYATNAADRLMAVDMETKKMSVVGSFQDFHISLPTWPTTIPPRPCTASWAVWPLRQVHYTR